MTLIRWSGRDLRALAEMRLGDLYKVAEAGLSWIVVFLCRENITDTQH
jgi:hypothetical protein